MRRITVGMIAALLLLAQALSVVAQTPTGEPAPVTGSDPATQPSTTATTADPATGEDYGTLPQTATPWPAMGLAGAFLLAAAFGLRQGSRRRARG